MPPRRILEIGPGPSPLHHRGIENSLQLKDNEEYHGIDSHEGMSERTVWKQAKEEYGDRVFLYQGDRTDLHQIANNSMDELVALGTYGRNGKAVREFDRVLKEGGKLLLGTNTSNEQALRESWGARLERRGYQELPSKTKRYTHKGNTSAESPFIVLVWQKGYSEESH
ncbi:hypothetical protein HQ487_00470 [Candidatus Uhrbacteria bacterium]|nr:hypothetical protein [Candidatus Uhrbacteria bacterium]